MQVGHVALANEVIHEYQVTGTDFSFGPVGNFYIQSAAHIDRDHTLGRSMPIHRKRFVSNGEDSGTEYGFGRR